MSKDRQELFKSLWAMANQVRGAVDGWDFKQYVYSALFYRYLSERLSGRINADEQVYEPDYDYALETDADSIANIREDILKTLGYFIEPQDLFVNVVKNADADVDLNLTLKTIFDKIVASATEDSKHAFDGIFGDVDTNSIRLGGTVQERNKRLISVLNGVASLDIPAVSNSDIDVFGDMFEYLASNYAANAGKVGGEFYTPQEVSELLANIVTYGKKFINKGYDMCCGSGSLLLKLQKAIDGSKIKVDKGLFGQEINVSTYNLCRMNMILHGIPAEKFMIKCGDTLLNHMFLYDDQKDEDKNKTEPFDAIVSNPPYSVKWEGKDNPVLCTDERFNKTAMAPKSKADMAFVLHALHCLSEEGTAAIVCFPGVLYRSGAEAKIREYLITNNYIDCIIQLPEDMFFGTNIATCILVLKKNKKDQEILFIDASDEYERVNSRNIMNKDNIKKVLETYAGRKNVEHFAYMVSQSKIKELGYNLSVNMYVEKPDTREQIDIDELEQHLTEIVNKEQVLRNEIDSLVVSLRKGFCCGHV